jgi:HD-like signal output (HDOD) protein
VTVPGFRTALAELRKWNFPDELIERYTEALRKAGVPEEPRE